MFAESSPFQMPHPKTQALEAILPPKKSDIEPRPTIVDEVPYENGDITDVRARSFPAGKGFFDDTFGQFGETDDDWVDEDEGDEDFDPTRGFFEPGMGMPGGSAPECRTQ